MYTSVPFTLSIFLSISVSSIGASRHVRQFNERIHVKCSSSFANKQGESLLEACRQMSVVRAKKLIQRGANVNYQENSPLRERLLSLKSRYDRYITRDDTELLTDETPLGLAAYHGHIGLVSILLDAGAQVDAPCWFGVPLLAAIRNPQGREETVRPIVELLLARGASVNCVNDCIDGYVLRSTYLAPPDCQETLSRGVSREAGWSGFWITPLIEAAARGYESIVTLLLDRKANVNHCNDGYDMSVRIAVLEEYQKAYSQMDCLYARQLDGLSICQNQCVKACAKIFMARAAFGTALDNAIQGGHEAIVAKLLAAGAEVNPKLPGHRTSIPGIAWFWKTGLPLAMAVRTGNQTIVQMLLEAGACVDKDRGPSGGTALWEAAKHNHVHLIPLLIAAGTNINQCPFEGPAWTAAINSRHEAALEALIEAEIDLDAPAKEKTLYAGLSPVMYAAAVDWRRGVELLFARGACTPTPEQHTILKTYCKRWRNRQSPQWSFDKAMMLLCDYSQSRIERVAEALKLVLPRNLALLTQSFAFEFPDKRATVVMVKEEGKK